MIWSVQGRFLDFKELRRETGVDADILKSQNKPQAHFGTRDHVWLQAVSGSGFTPFLGWELLWLLFMLERGEQFSLTKPSLTKRISLDWIFTNDNKCLNAHQTFPKHDWSDYWRILTSERWILLPDLSNTSMRISYARPVSRTQLSPGWILKAKQI